MSNKQSHLASVPKIPAHSKLKRIVVNGREVYGKLCKSCKDVKPLDQFHVDQKGVGGRKAKCKLCRYPAT